MSDNAKQKGIYLDEVNGHSDHAHCLLSPFPCALDNNKLPPDLSGGYIGTNPEGL